MIIPSIDIMGGQTVQLIGGKEKALDAGDPVALAEKFRVVGDIAVIDLDRALGQGSNEEIIKKVVNIAPCRVGGGIRDLETAVKWLDAGAKQVILGTKAVPEILSELPTERVLAALDAYEGEVVVKGWTEGTGRTIIERMVELRDYVGGFLVTFVEREGRLQGTDMAMAAKIVEAAGSAKVTIAGGVTTTEDIKQLDELGADAQVGMAIYTGKMTLGDAFCAPLTSDRPDGLWSTVVADESGRALGLAWSSPESLSEAIECGRGIYQSRKRGLWRKGESSGNVQELLKVDADCDRDALRFIVRQTGEGFCHKNTMSCWGEFWGVSGLWQTIVKRLEQSPPGSYTGRLFEEPGLLGEKLKEEAQELADAHCPEDTVREAADLIYFTLVSLAKAGVSLSDVDAELERRSRRVTRRPGNAKTKKG